METPNENKPAVRVYDTEPAVVTTAGDSTAEQFVHKELADARKSLRLTQIIASVAAIGTMIYTGSIASTLNKTLEPTAAAQVATGLISAQVETAGPQIASEVRTRIPKLIEELPDYALKQIPQYRVALENQIETDMTKYFTASSKELGASFDELLDANKESIAQMLKDGQDVEATKAVGDAVEKEILSYARETSINGETLSTKLDEAYVSLSAIDTRMARLATNQNLTPSEKKARRAIGLLTRTIETAQKKSGGKII